MDITPVANGTGRVTHWVAVERDITDRKRAEGALRASEQQFKSLYEQAAVGVAQADAATGRYLQVNRRFCEIAGRSRTELEHLTFAAITHAQDLGHSLEMTRRVQSGDLREFTQEKRYVRGDGTEVWVSATTSAMWPPGAKPDFFITIAQDITARKQLEQQFMQAQKMEAIGTLAGGIAHDFNNILTAIVCYAELGRLELADNSEVREYLGGILQASSRASDLVRQILTFSRQERPERRVISLEPVMAESLKLLRASLPASIEFDLALATDAPTVLADATQVHQVLMNLGTNSWHAMKGQPGRLRVKLERCAVDAVLAATQPRLRPGLYARVTVGDTGCGMDDATLRRMFEPFFTTKAPGEGTGLGLAVVHGVMENHDGAVTVVSQPGQGTDFHLYFPAHAGEASTPARDDEPAVRGHGENILVVDDEEVLVQMMTRALVTLGYRVEATSDSAIALELVRADPQRFALLLTDQTMPGLTGLALVRKVRQIRPDLPIILMSGYGGSALTGEIQAAGIRQVLKKPMSIQALGVAVRTAMTPQTLL